MISKSDLKWRCRRGMLELDEVFSVFLEKGYDDLSQEEQALLVDLLDQSDQTLWRWFLNVEVAEPTYQKLIHHILSIYRSE